MNENKHLLEILNNIYSYNILFNTKEEIAIYLDRSTLKTDNFSKLQKDVKNNNDALEMYAAKLNRRIEELIPESMDVCEIQDIYMSCLTVYKDVIKQRRRNNDFDLFLESILDDNYINHTRKGQSTSKLNDAFEKISSVGSHIGLVLMGKGWLQTSPTKTKGIDDAKLQEDFDSMFDFIESYCKKVIDETLPIISYYRHRAQDDNWRCQLTLLYAAMDIIAVLDSYVNPNMDTNNAYSQLLFTPWEITNKVWYPEEGDPEEERYEFHALNNRELNMLHLYCNSDKKKWCYSESVLVFQKQPATTVAYKMSKKYLLTRILGGTGHNEIGYYNMEYIEETEGTPDKLIFTKTDGTESKTLMEAATSSFSYSYIRKNNDAFTCIDDYCYDELGYIQAMTRSAIYVYGGKGFGKIYRVPRILSYGLSEYTMNNSGFVACIPQSDINPNNTRFVLTFFDANKFIDVTAVQTGMNDVLDVCVTGVKCVTIDNEGVYLELNNTESYYIWKAQNGRGKDKSFAQRLNDDYIVMTNKITYKYRDSKEVLVDEIRIENGLFSFLKETSDGTMEPVKELRTKNVQTREIIIDDYISFDVSEMMFHAKIITIGKILD